MKYKNKVFFILGLIMIMFSGIVSAYSISYLYNSNEVSYNNNSSGMNADNVQDAIDELYQSAVDYSSFESRVSNIETKISGVENKFNRVVAMGVVSSAKSAPSGTFGSYAFDSVNIYDSEYASNSSNIITIKKAGVYKIIYRGRFADVTATRNVYLGPSISNGLSDDGSGTWGNMAQRLTVTGVYVTSLSANATIKVMVSGSGLPSPGLNYAQFTIECLSG